MDGSFWGKVAEAALCVVELAKDRQARQRTPPMEKNESQVALYHQNSTKVSRFEESLTVPGNFTAPQH